MSPFKYKAKKSFLHFFQVIFKEYIFRFFLLPSRYTVSTIMDLNNKITAIKKYVFAFKKLL